MNYFPAPHERPYGDGTNLRTSYCHFSTSSRLDHLSTSHAAWNVDAVHGVHAEYSSNNLGTAPRLHRPIAVGSSWRERAKRRPSVTARRSAYASRGSVGL